MSGKVANALSVTLGNGWGANLGEPGGKLYLQTTLLMTTHLSSSSSFFPELRILHRLPVCLPACLLAFERETFALFLVLLYNSKAGLS